MTKENRQYFIVGLFVIITTIILISVWLWFSSNNRQNYNTFLAIFNEPVDGLSVNAVVKYNGVEVGKVKKIQLDNTNPRNIFVYLNVMPNITINKKTFASMKSQGVTGLSYIELRLPIDAAMHNNITPHNEEPYPQIATRNSLLYGLSEQAQSVSKNIQEISGQMKLALSNENIKQFSDMLKNLNKITSSIASKSDNISSGIKDLSVTITYIKNSTKELDRTLKHIDTLASSLTNTSDNTNKLINHMQNVTLNNINSVLLPNLNQTISHINLASIQLEQFMRLINQNPQVIIRGVERKNPGPGETK
ncbi:MAG: MlaD family protein [Proteobacteria bacterium]|jgi:phospholipid/cholesterol/gamma-HCH transport system substrate-binding protein|nr:MlaD family protein [Pseudomonadota bacterium]